MPKITAYNAGAGSFTPILTDLLYGVDDPLGTPDSGAIEITALLALLDASTSTFTGKTFDLDANTLTATLAEFNAALQGDSFFPLSGGAVTGDFSAGAFFSISTREDLTISSGVVTATRSNIRLDGEGAASDDLDTMTITGAPDGTLFVLGSNATPRVITVKDGTGNFITNGDFVMDNFRDRMFLTSIGSDLYEIGRSKNA